MHPWMAEPQDETSNPEATALHNAGSVLPRATQEARIPNTKLHWPKTA